MFSRDTVKEGKPDLEIAKMLIISTAHVSQETAKLLEGGDYKDVSELPLMFTWGDYGWLIWADCEPEEENGFPDDLQRCMDFSSKNGCAWLRLDCDGDQVDGLEYFDW